MHWSTRHMQKTRLKILAALDWKYKQKLHFDECNHIYLQTVAFITNITTARINITSLASYRNHSA